MTKIVTAVLGAASSTVIGVTKAVAVTITAATTDVTVAIHSMTDTEAASKSAVRAVPTTAIEMAKNFYCHGHCCNCSDEFCFCWHRFSNND